MKHAIPFIIIASALLPSCKGEGSGVCEPVQGTLTLSYQISAVTKVQVPSETCLATVSFLIFNTLTGELERTLDLDPESGEVSLGIKAGPKTVFAYANHSVSGVGTTLAAQPITGSAGLGESSWGNFPMRGSLTVDVPAGGMVSSSMYLTRCASRISVKSIANNLPGGLPLTILGAYLADAYMADTPGSVSTDSWAWKWGRDASLALPVSVSGSICTWTEGLPYTIANGAEWTVPQPSASKGPRMYCMPNTATADGSPWQSGASWTPCVSKLVLIARTGSSAPFYYSIPLPGLMANESREYILAIHGIGTTDPELPAGTITFSLAPSSTPYDPGATYTDITTPSAP